MPETSAQKLSLAGIFDQLDNNEVVSVRAGDLKDFLNQVGRGDPESSLTFAYRGIEQEAALVGKHLANGVDAEVVCDITWWREDVLKACEHVYGIELNRDDDGVEEMIDGVLVGIGSGLQDRSTEFGYELIYQHLPEREQIVKLARRFDRSGGSVTRSC